MVRVASSGDTCRLTAAQTDTFRRDGYLFPLRALSPAEAHGVRSRLEAFEASQGRPLSASFRTKSHLVFAWVAELVRNERILDAIESLLGPDLLVWSSGFFITEARDPSYVSWHQNYRSVVWDRSGAATQ
jgi:non-heme Fe2+,alpha-ketoglutarate-dependent halogenase